MKKVTRIASIMILVIGMIGMGSVAQALLMDQVDSNGDHVVFDDQTEQYWIWDLSTFGQQDYAGQMENIEALDYYGITAWRMATLADIQGLSANGAENISNAFGESLPTPSYYDSKLIGRYNEVMSAQSHYKARVDLDWLGNPVGFSIDTGVVDDLEGMVIGAWVVADAGSQAPIPEPGTLILLGPGILGLLVLRRKYSQHR
jgi:hypothetical protein